MQYMLLIYGNERGNESASADRDEKTRKETFAEYGKFTAEVKQSGHFVAGDALQPTGSATTVRVREGKRLSTDGPFAETKEQLGGYYLVNAKDLDEAMAIAARIPGARVGSIEVRPVMKM